MKAGKPEKNPTFVKELAKILEYECGLYAAYVKTLANEKEAITKFNAENVSALTEQRLLLTEQIKAAKEQRFMVLDALPEGRKEKLSNLLQKYAHIEDAKRLMPLVQKLKVLVVEARQKSMEFNQIANFSLGIVNGSLSILWSATQNVVRSYDTLGSLKESYNPSTGRAAGVLRSA